MDHRDYFILQGFVDTCLHFLQVNSIESYGGGQFLERLDNYSFPAEARLANEAFEQGGCQGVVRPPDRYGNNDNPCVWLCDSGRTRSLFQRIPPPWAMLAISLVRARVSQVITG